MPDDAARDPISARIPDPAGLAPGRRLGRYALVRALGRGGQGEVWEATLLGPGGFRRQVALKVLRASEGLAREARLGGLLRHPNLVDVYEVGEVDGTWFLAMELCADGALDARAPLPPRAVVDVGLQVCEALQYAHEALGLVHLDLKPQNLLLHGPVVKVADLGIAVARGYASDGRPRGTPGYRAPEQAAGGPVDARADLHALGATLLALATGRPPAAERTLDLDDLDDDVPPDLPDGWLEPVLARCLRADPAERFASARDLADALRALTVDGPGLDRLVAPRAEATQSSVADALVGRERELEALERALAVEGGAALLKGPAGIGKSRLAREVARRTRDARLVDAGGVRDPRELTARVASAFDAKLGGGDDADHVDAVGRAIAALGDVLVALDGLEGLGEVGAIAQWRALAPRARWLLASQVALRLDAEVIEVPPLDPEASVALLAARARQRGVEVGADPAVRALAQRLDGIPLALELAAGRLGVLSAAEVLARLDLSLLRSGRPEADRQATLRGALAWSWSLLGPGEREGLARLSTFCGPFSPEAADFVLDAARAASADVLGALLDRSLVLAEAGGLRLLGPVQAFAAEQLGDARDAAERRHGAWFARFGDEGWLGSLATHGGEVRRAALARDLDDLVAACRRAAARGDGGVAVPVLRAACAVLTLRGPLRLAVELAEDVAAMGGLAPQQRALAHFQLGQARQLLGRMTSAAEATEEARRIAEGLGDARLEGAALGMLGTLARDAGDADLAASLYERALARHREAGDLRLEATTTSNLGRLRHDQERHDEALGHYERSLALYRRAGHRVAELVVTLNLGLLAQDRSELGAARERLEAALAIAREVGDRRSEGFALANLGGVVFEAGDVAAGRALVEAGLAVHREVGNRRSEGVALGLIAETWEAEDPSAALAAWEAAVAVHREVGNRRFEELAVERIARLLAGPASR